MSKIKNKRACAAAVDDLRKVERASGKFQVQFIGKAQFSNQMSATPSDLIGLHFQNFCQGTVFELKSIFIRSFAEFVLKIGGESVQQDGDGGAGDDDDAELPNFMDEYMKFIMESGKERCTLFHYYT